MPDASLSLTPPSKRPRADSRGEELFLVHLQRMAAPDPHPEDAEDDHDYEIPRKPNKSIGEELFEVHLKRSVGLELDCDDSDAKESNEKPIVKETEKESQNKTLAT